MSETAPAAEVDAQEEPEVEEQEEAPAAESQEPQAKKADELKVVIIIKDDGVMLGVQSTDCDPVYTTLKGTLATALKRVPKLVEEAKLKWSTSPRNPKANLPTPEPRPASARTQPAVKTKPAQPSFF